MTLATLYTVLLYVAAGILAVLIVTLLQRARPRRLARPIDAPAARPAPRPGAIGTLDVAEPLPGQARSWNQPSVDAMRTSLQGTPTGEAVEILLYYLYHPSTRAQLLWTGIGVFGGVIVSLGVQALAKALGLG